jgi:tight adherence protein C
MSRAAASPSRLARIPAEDWTPASIRNAYASRLIIAGNPVSLRGFLLSAILSLIGLPILGFIFGLAMRWAPLGIAATIAFGFLLGAILPLLWVQDRVRRRRSEISRALPGTLDLVAIATQSGLVIDTAVARVAALVPGALGVEMQRTIAAIQLGQSRETAWEEMAARLQAPDVARFCYSIVQSQQLGAGIAKALHEQGRQIRSTYAQRIRQRSVKMSIAMIFPIVFLVLPSIFLAVLGPALFQLFAKGA